MTFHSTISTQGNSLSFSNENIGITGKLKKYSRNKEFITNKMSISINSLNNLSRNKYKNIILCISEKILEEINGKELKYVLMKFFKKYFSNGIEKDKFGFIQFSYKGKRTISINSDSLDIFIQKLESNKTAFEINDILSQNNRQIQFNELSNLFFKYNKITKANNL